MVGQTQEPRDGDAFVQGFPPHPKAELDDFEISHLLGRRPIEPAKPRKRHPDFATILKGDEEAVSIDRR